MELLDRIKVDSRVKVVAELPEEMLIVTQPIGLVETPDSV